jgi:hypothetical protein
MIAALFVIILSIWNYSEEKNHKVELCKRAILDSEIVSSYKQTASLPVKEGEYKLISDSAKLKETERKNDASAKLVISGEAIEITVVTDGEAHQIKAKYHQEGSVLSLYDFEGNAPICTIYDYVVLVDNAGNLTKIINYPTQRLEK